METYLIEYDDKIIGVYDNYTLAELFILSCLQNNLMINSANILTYTNNSCYKTKSTQVNLVKSDNKKVVFLNDTFNKTNQLKSPLLSPPFNKTILNMFTPNNTPLVDLPKPELNPDFFDLANKKIELQHNINMLKVKKQRIEESKNVFDNDIKLFDLFTDRINEDKDFIIPKLFEIKYNLMKELKDENKLDWENFTDKYKELDKTYNDYFVSTTYDLKFENPKE